MIKTRYSPNLISFVTIRRGSWVMKVSVFKAKFVMIVGQHYYDKDKFFVKQFLNHESAADFIESMAQQESDYE